MPGSDQHNALSALQEKVARRLVRCKRELQCAFRRSTGQALPIFVMGYGRSGTTMLLNTFALDERLDICRENDPRIARDYMLVYEKVKREISTCKADALVMKPILNSFDAAQILQTYERARIIWMIRDYQDVASSAVARFGSTVADYLKEAVTTGGCDNWLARGVPEDTLRILRKMEVTGFTGHDWMGLIWWSVNRTILMERLYESRRFFLLRYEDLVQNTDFVLATLYDFLELKYKRSVGIYIHGRSVGKGSGIRLRKTVREMCDKLLQDINASCQLTSKVENGEVKE